MLFGWLLWLLAGTARMGLPADTGTYYLAREIVVWGHRSLEQAHRLPISYLFVKTSEPGDLVARPSLSLRDYIGIAGLSLRGSGMEEIQVLVEGFPAKPAQSGYLDLNLFPRGFWQGVEAAANPLSAYFGADAMAGVVNLQLDFRPGARLWFGSLGGRGLTGHHTVALSRWDLVQVSFAWDRGPEAFHTTDAFGRTLQVDNLGHTRWSGALRGFHGSTEFLAVMGNRSGGLPRVPNVSLHRDSLDQFLALFGLRHGGLQVTAAFHQSRYRPEQGSRAVHQEGTLDARYRYRFLEIRGAVTRVRSTAVGLRERWVGQMALRDTARWGPLFALYALRGYASTTVPRPVLTATAGLQVSPGPYILLSTGFREPTFNELYWPRDPYAEGNPTLRPEQSWEVEAGWKRRGPRGALRLAVFHREVSRLIQWIPLDGRYRPRNVSHALLEGVEAMLRLRHRSLSVEVAGSGFLRMQAPGHLLYVPWAQAYGSVEWGPVAVVYQWVGPRWERPTGPKTLPPVHLVNLRFRIPLGPLWFTLEGRNLLNASYQWVRGYPLPGRHWIGELTWNGGVPGFVNRIVHRKQKQGGVL